MPVYGIIILTSHCKGGEPMKRPPYVGSLWRMTMHSLHRTSSYHGTSRLRTCCPSDGMTATSLLSVRLFITMRHVARRMYRMRRLAHTHKSLLLQTVMCAVVITYKRARTCGHDWSRIFFTNDQRDFPRDNVTATCPLPP